MPIEIKTKDPELQPLIDFAVGSAAYCRRENGCEGCSSAIKRTLPSDAPQYGCKLGLALVSSSFAEKLRGKDIEIEDITRVEMASRAYAGRDAGLAFEDMAIKLMMTSKPKR